MIAKTIFIMDGYTQLRQLLADIGVQFNDSGNVADNLGKQVHIDILDAQSTQTMVSFYWDIAVDGSEIYICQE